MDVFFTIVLILHAFTHLLGFLKAFQLVTLKEMNTPISKLGGIAWLLACLFLMFTVVCFLTETLGFKIIFLCSLLFSQTIVICYWKVAKFGTVANILLAIIFFGLIN